MAIGPSATATETGIKAEPATSPSLRMDISPRTQRLSSLDAFRGWTMFWIVGGSALVAGLQALNANRVINGLVYELNHSDWQGLRFYDLIWPSFMLMTGMSLPFSYAKRSLTETHRQILMRVLRRFLVLFLLGSLRESIHFNRPYLIELSSALQPIAVAYLAAFLIVPRSWRFQAAVGAGILVFYALLLAFVPAPGVPAGSYDRNANLVLWTDLVTVGRVLPEHWGTVICTLPTISTTIVGMLAGRASYDEPQRGEQNENHRLGRAVRRRAGLGLEPCDPNRDEDLDHLLWTGVGRLCLPDVSGFLLAGGCPWLSKTGLPVLGDRHECGGDLHVGEHYPLEQDGSHLYAPARRNTGLVHTACSRDCGSNCRVACAVLDVQAQDFPYCLTHAVAYGPFTRSRMVSPLRDSGSGASETVRSETLPCACGGRGLG